MTGRRLLPIAAACAACAIAQAQAVLEYQLHVPEGLIACASFFEGRTAREVLGLKAKVGLKAGTQVVRTDGSGSADLFEWIQPDPSATRISPTGPGVWSVEVISDPRGYRFALTQEFRVNGERALVSLEKLTFAESGPADIVLDSAAITFAINPYGPLHLALEYPDAPAERHRSTWMLPCDLSLLPLWTVDVQFRNGDRVHFEERFDDVLDGTGPAELVKGVFTMAGRAIVFEDYWRLVYTAGHHNERPDPEHWMIFDPPLEVAGAGRAKVLGVAKGAVGDEPRAFFLDEDFREILSPEIVLFRRQSPDGPFQEQFRRGDVDSSGRLTISDPIGTLRYVFGGVDIGCPDAADVDDQGTVEIDDAILLLAYLFLGLDPPLDPGPFRCGVDAATDELGPCDDAACR